MLVGILIKERFIWVRITVLTVRDELRMNREIVRGKLGLALVL
jgi:hypothetical protein